MSLAEGPPISLIESTKLPEDLGISVLPFQDRAGEWKINSREEINLFNNEVADYFEKLLSQGEIVEMYIPPHGAIGYCIGISERLQAKAQQDEGFAAVLKENFHIRLAIKGRTFKTEVEEQNGKDVLETVFLTNSTVPENKLKQVRRFLVDDIFDTASTFNAIAETINDQLEPEYRSAETDLKLLAATIKPGMIDEDKLKYNYLPGQPATAEGPPMPIHVGVFPPAWINNTFFMNSSLYSIFAAIEKIKDLNLNSPSFPISGTQMLGIVDDYLRIQRLEREAVIPVTGKPTDDIAYEEFLTKNSLHQNPLDSPSYQLSSQIDFYALVNYRELLTAKSLAEERAWEQGFILNAFDVISKYHSEHFGGTMQPIDIDTRKNIVSMKSVGVRIAA
jgi:hypothetical protein